MTHPHSDNGVKKFGDEADVETIPFSVMTDEVFEAWGEIPGQFLLDLYGQMADLGVIATGNTVDVSAMAEAVEQSGERQQKIVHWVVDTVGRLLLPESRDRFMERFSGQRSPAIGLNRALEVVTWLMGETAGRPTGSPSTSLPGSSATDPQTLPDGPTSTEATPPAESILPG